MTIHLVTGNDPVLRDDAVAALVDGLLAGEDRSLTVEEFTVPGRGETDEPVGRDDLVGAVVNATSSPPFMTTRRIVIVRDIGNLRAADAAPLVASLDDPLPTTELILVVGEGKTPETLDKAARAHGTVTGPTSEKTSDVLSLELTTHDLDVTRDARDAIRAHVGDDAGLVPGLVATLRAAYPPGTTLDVDEVTPYLGEAGSIPVWDLTNAIERGDIPGALATVRRLLTVTSPRQPKPMHPLQITAMLHGHYRRLLRVDDPAVRTNEDAAAAIGGRTNPRAAGFRLRQARALGTDGLRRAFDLLARADLDLKGARAIPEDAVVELLVGRLAALTPGSRRGPARSGRPSPRAS